MNEIAVVQRLQAEVGELLVALGLERLAEVVEIELEQLAVEQFEIGGFFHVVSEIIAVAFRHFGESRGRRAIVDKTERFGAQLVEQQARGDLRILGFAVDQAARAHDHGRADVLERYAVEQVFQGFIVNALCTDGFESVAGFVDNGFQARGIERLDTAILALHRDLDAFLVVGRFTRIDLALRACGGALFAVEHVGARDLLLAVAHQREFDLVLDILDVEGAAVGLAPGQGRNYQIGQLFDGFVDAGRRRGLAALDREKGLGHRDRDLVLVETGQLAVAADDVVVCAEGVFALVDGGGGRFYRRGRGLGQG